MLSSIDERERESVEECDVITVRCIGSPSAGSENGVITNSIKPFILLCKINLLYIYDFSEVMMKYEFSQ